MDILSRTLKALEWDKLVQHLALECQTAMAQDEVRTLTLVQDRATIDRLLAETTEATSILAEQSFGFLKDLTELKTILSRLRAQATLNADELLKVRNTLQISKLAKAFLANLPKDSFPELSEYEAKLSSVNVVLQAIDAVIDEQGEIKDEASPALGSLRRELRGLENKIKEELNRLIRAQDIAKALQEPIHTVRSNRYVLPVVAAMRSSVPGIVHDSSASGLTVYIEPLSVVELSNSQRIKENEIEREILRILEEITTIVLRHTDEIDQTHRTLLELDKIFARARLGIKYNGTIPEIAAGNSFELREARHPLLVLNGARHVVGNDLVLGTKESDTSIQGTTLVITGPNTGGKTVLLKTIGLLSLMLRAGLMLPVKQGSSVRIFTEVYADIGDEQSLEQSLSTFSAHMTNIVEILDSAKASSLVLLDEVGAGTDPKEGAALAQAIMEHLNNANSLTIVTTHLAELKTLAYGKAGFVNGSFEFDEQSLLPTYKLRIGIAGRSQAVAIAQRLGLKSSIIERTQGLMEGAGTEIESTIQAMEDGIARAAEREEKSRLIEDSVAKLKNEYENKLESLEAETEEIRQTYLAKFNAEFKAAKELIREVTAELQKRPDSAKAQAAQTQIEKLKEDLGWLGKPETTTGQSNKLKLGQKVLVRSLNQLAIVDQLPEDVSSQNDPVVQLRIGHFKLKVPASDLKADFNAVAGGATRQKSKQHQRSRPAPPSTRQTGVSPPTPGVLVQTDDNTLDLRGQRVDESLLRLTSFLNAAVLSGTSPLLIIHGHGTGALKSAVREELSRSDFPVDFRPGQSHEGGDGVTVIFLR